MIHGNHPHFVLFCSWFGSLRVTRQVPVQIMVLMARLEMAVAMVLVHAQIMTMISETINAIPSVHAPVDNMCVAIYIAG